MRNLIALLVLALVSLALPACAPTPTATPPQPTVAPPTSAAAHPAVAIRYDIPDSVVPGMTLPLSLTFEPLLFSGGTTASGASFVSTTPWQNSNVAEMRICVEATPCKLDGEWIPFSPWTYNQQVDWLGERGLFISAEFRDTNGNIIPGLDSSGPTHLAPTANIQLTLNSVLDTRTPIAAYPAPIQTTAATTRIAFPITGSLVLQRGLCCAGGKVGSTINIEAAFAATSTVPITQMRLAAGCPTTNEMNNAPWEPFIASKSFPYQVSVPNFVGWYLAVQYRDSAGNLSPVYCDDISIEGTP